MVPAGIRKKKFRSRGVVLCTALGGFGADGEIRTLMGFPAAPSRRCVCQFHHIRNSKT